MAILLVRIENEQTLAFNEFFDYAGYCYASTRSREKTEDKVIDLTSFYEADVNTEVLHDIPVVFVSVEEKTASVLGWYQKADVFQKMQTPSLFLEGNIRAYASDVVWLPKEKQDRKVNWFLKNELYDVIEEEDTRYAVLSGWMKMGSGKNQMLRYHTAGTHVIAKAQKDLSLCKAACEQWASLAASEECQDLRDLKTLEVYARVLCEKERKNPDGYYYLALACYHLGFVKEGLKQINKALQLEPEASDLMALKGLLLVSKGYPNEGADYLQKAFEAGKDEVYLLLEGRAYLMAGKIENAYACFKKMEDQKMLEDMGIRLQDMEKKWSFIKVQYQKLKDMFRRK